MDLTRVRQGVKDLKGVLDELSLISYLKTSGGKGYHVVVPLRPSVSWGMFHNFANGLQKLWSRSGQSDIQAMSGKRAGQIKFLSTGFETAAAPRVLHPIPSERKKSQSVYADYLG